MSIYRRQHHDRASGKLRRSRFLTAEFRFRGQLYRRGGFVDRESARHWMMTEMLRLRRGAVGYVKSMLRAQVVPLIEEFVNELRGKRRSDDYCDTLEWRLKRMAGEAGWLTLANVTRESIEHWQASDSFWVKRPKRPIGNKSKNQFVQAAVTWGKWLAKRHLPTNPLADISHLRADENQAYRRAATQDEFNLLLAKCPPTRRLFYIFRLYCPLRNRTIERLTWRMLHLDDERPWMLLPAGINKSGKDERSPLPFYVAQLLRQHKRKVKAKADDAVFDPCPTLANLRADLETAGIAFDDGKGSRRLDFHAFRKTLIRWCKRAGVSLDDASLLLHHKDVRTTRRHYDDDAVDPDLTAAIEKLPRVGQVRGGAA